MSLAKRVSWTSIAHAHRDQLVKAYDRFNRQFWDKSLPSSSDIYLHLIPAGQFGEVVTCQDFGGCSKHVDDGGRERFVIEIRWQTDRGFRYLCLLHEMIHVAIWDEDDGVEHGKAFKDEALRIGQLGALIHVI